MPRLSSILCALLAPTLTVACQATVNVTGATETETNTGDGSNSNTNDGSGTAVTTGPCIAGEQGCSCYPNETCNGDLVCDEKVCKLPPGTTTGTTTDTTTDTTTGKTTGTTTDTTADTGDTTGKPDSTGVTTVDTGDTTVSTSASTTDGTTGGASDTSGDTSGGTTGGTTGGVEPNCGDVPNDMACVPANTFEMGTDLKTFQGWPVFPYEQPAHAVTLSKSFWIDLTEVTVEDYSVCWALKVCKLPMQGPKLNWGVPGKDKHPANGVTWYDAKQYCEWKGKRLPTEAEWELAARGDDGRMFAWGNTKPTCAHVASEYCGEGEGTHAVGSKPLGDSPYGVHDMGGNVLEWCADYYKEDYYYESPEVDPKGPANGTARSIRSSAFVFEPDYSLQRATLRYGGSPLLADTNPAAIGFRCAQTPP